MLTPPDLERCQAEVPTQGPFQMGGEIGDPKNGYRIRCRNEPKYVATEKRPGKDGLCGAMSLCSGCRDAMERQCPGVAEFETIEEYSARQ